MKKQKKLFKFILGFSALGILTSVPIILSSCTESSKEQLIPYENTQESLNKIAKNIKYNDFQANTNIELGNLKPTDITWKNNKFYPDLLLEIINLKKQKEYKPTPSSDIIFKNVAIFGIKITDKKDPNILYQTNLDTTYFIAYFK